jgi:hypothetical protein
VQQLAWDTTEVMELWEEVTRVQAAAVMVRVRAAQAEGMVWEKIALLATTHGEAVEVTQRVSILRDDLVVVGRAQDAAKEKALSLAAKAAMTDQRREATEEQSERLVHELTLLSLRGSKMCITITGTPPMAHLHEGMRFAAAQHTEIATQLSTL